VGRLLWEGAGTWLTLSALMGAGAWFIYRVVKGWTRLSDGDPVRDW